MKRVAAILGLMVALAMAAPAVAQSLKDLRDDVLAPVGVVFSSFQECLDRQNELREQAKAKGEEAWALAVAYKWTLPMKPGGSGAKALYKAADDLRRAADQIKCIYRKPESDNAARLKEAFEVLKRFKKDGLKRYPKAIREYIKNNLTSIEKHGYRLMDELATIQTAVATGQDPAQAEVATPAPSESPPAPSGAAVLVPNCKWTGNDIRYIEREVVCFAPGSSADRFEPSASPDAKGTDATYKGYGVTVYIMEQWADWQPECAAAPYGRDGECKPEPTTWRDDLADWPALENSE